MANIKKKSKVKGMVPAEVVKAVSTGKENPNEALYNSLSLNAKVGETEAEREAKKFRRRYICRAFNLKADDLEHFLEEYKKSGKNRPAMSEADVLKNQEAAAKDEKRASKALSREAKTKIFDTLKTLVTLAGFKVAPGITIIASIIGLGIGLRRNKKAQEGQAAKETKEQIEYVEKLDGYMGKINAMNKYMEADMAEIMAKKKELSDYKFSQYMKLKMSQIKEKMKEDGYEIADEPEKDGDEAEKGSKSKPKKSKPKKTKTTKKETTEPEAEAGEKEA